MPPKFDEVLRGKPSKAQERFMKALALLGENPRHPSLRTRRLTGAQDNRWYARASRGERITFYMEGQTITLIMNCGHEIL